MAVHQQKVLPVFHLTSPAFAVSFSNPWGGQSAHAVPTYASPICVMNSTTKFTCAA